MQFQLIHILCADKKASDSICKAIDEYECIVESWQHKNSHNRSLYLVVNEQDQEMFDMLNDKVDKESVLRINVQAIESSFPKTKEDEKREEAENDPGFFDIISREDMENTLFKQAKLSGSYLSLVFLSSVIAALAVMQGNIIMLIGAIMLTPLLGPNLAFSFAVATSNRHLLCWAAMSGGAGMLLSFLVPAAIGLTESELNTEFMNLFLDYGYESIVLAGAVGIAASILLLQGASSVLIGVAVAIAFLPPLAVAGVSMSHGNYVNMVDALVLFAINVTAFNIATKATLLLAGIRPWKQSEKKASFRRVLFYIAGWMAMLGILAYGLSFLQSASAS